MVAVRNLSNCSEPVGIEGKPVAVVSTVLYMLDLDPNGGSKCPMNIPPSVCCNSRQTNHRESLLLHMVLDYPVTKMNYRIEATKIN